MKSTLLVILIVCLFTSSVVCQSFIGGCNDGIDHCNEWTLGSDNVWGQCKDRCIKEGFKFGRCSTSPTCPAGQPYQCRCH
nr:hypothetical protein BgiMline_013760 [Biomphalaria glabrata]